MIPLLLDTQKRRNSVGEIRVSQDQGLEGLRALPEAFMIGISE
jgi:hypothetical protein